MVSQRSLLGEQASFIHPSLRVASAPGASVSVFNSGPLCRKYPIQLKRSLPWGERDRDRESGGGGSGKWGWDERECVSVCVCVFMYVHVHDMVSTEEFGDYCYQVTVSGVSALL